MRLVGLVAAYIVLVGAVVVDIGQGHDQRRDIIRNQAILCRNQVLLLTALAAHDQRVDPELERAARCGEVIP